MKALVVGGTGPTGPLIVQGLMDRGYEVTLYHRGFHEPDDLPQTHSHVHGDPFTKETFEKDVEGQEWDIVVSMYGRLRHIADVVAGRTGKLVGAGGPSFIRPEHLTFPRGLEMPLPEEFPTYTERDLNPYGFAIAHTERRVMEHHRNGDFAAVMFRYTSVYGPRAPRQWMWSIVKRVLDGRKQIIIPGDGSQLRLTCYAENAAHMVLLGCDKSEGDGHIFNSVDEVGYTVRDTVRIVAEALDHEFEMIEIGHPMAYDLAGGYSNRRTGQLSVYSMKKLLGYRDVVPPDEGMRRSAKWMVDNWSSLDHEQMQVLMADPLAYDIEDQLIASAKEWAGAVESSIPKPEIPQLDSSRDWRGAFRPPQPGSS